MIKVCLSVCLSFCPSVNLPVFKNVSMPVSVFLPISLSVSDICLVCLSEICLSVCQFVCLSFNLFISSIMTSCANVVLVKLPKMWLELSFQPYRLRLSDVQETGSLEVIPENCALDPQGRLSISLDQVPSVN